MHGPNVARGFSRESVSLAPRNRDFNGRGSMLRSVPANRYRRRLCTSRRPFPHPRRLFPFENFRCGVIVPGLPLRLLSRIRCPARSTRSSQPLPVFTGRGCSTPRARYRTLWFATPSPRPPVTPLRDRLPRDRRDWRRRIGMPALKSARSPFAPRNVHSPFGKRRRGSSFRARYLFRGLLFPSTSWNHHHDALNRDSGQV
jgi:hypothetical protein